MGREGDLPPSLSKEESDSASTLYHGLLGSRGVGRPALILGGGRGTLLLSEVKVTLLLGLGGGGRRRAEQLLGGGTDGGRETLLLSEVRATLLLGGGRGAWLLEGGGEGHC